MSLVTKLMYGRELPECDCANRDLMPRWAHPEHMDDDSKALGFVCHNCGREYPTYRVENRRLTER